MTAKTKAKKRGALWGCILFLLPLAVPAGMAGFWLWKLAEPYQGYAGAERIVSVEPGMKVRFGPTCTVVRLVKKVPLAEVPEPPQL